MSKTSEEQLYYIQNGYQGNAMVFWPQNRSGYTERYELAGKFTRAEVDKILSSGRPEVAWPCELIDDNEKAKRVIIDAQYLDHTKKIRPTN